MRDEKLQQTTPQSQQESSFPRADAVAYPAPHSPFLGQIAAFEAPVQRYTGKGKLYQANPEKGIVGVRDNDSEEYRLAVAENRWVHPGLGDIPVKYALTKEKEPAAIIEIPDHLRQYEHDYVKSDAQSVHNKITSGTRLGGLLASRHSLARQDEEHGASVNHLAGSIVSGGFTSKRDQRGKIKLEGQSLQALKDSVSDFYDVTDILRTNYQDPLQAAQVNHLTLYRAVATQDKGQNQFVETLPSSTSFSLKFVKKWAEANRGKENYIIFEINVPVTHNMLVLAYPEKYFLQYPAPFNQKQGEVTLAPSTLTRTGSRDDDGFHIVEVNAEMLSKQEAQTAIQEQSDNRGKDISSQDMFKVFQSIAAFFTLRSLKKKFADDFSVWDGNIVESNFQLSSSFITHLRHKDSEQSFKAVTSFDAGSGAISIALHSWEEEYGFDDSEPEDATSEQESKAAETKYKATEVNYTYSKKDIGDIYYSALSGSLDQVEVFEYISWPEAWPQPEYESDQD